MGALLVDEPPFSEVRRTRDFASAGRAVPRCIVRAISLLFDEPTPVVISTEIRAPSVCAFRRQRMRGARLRA